MKALLAALVLAPLSAPALEPGVAMPHHEHSILLVDIPEFEWRDGDDGAGLAWEGGLSWGGDLNKLVVASEGERVDGRTEEHQLYAFWQRAWLANWGLELGLREDTRPSDPRVTWASAGIAGEAPGFIETRATLYVSEYDQAELRLEFEKEILFTQRLILEPEIEARFFRTDEPWRGVASGLATSEAELRLKYEVIREFAPYVGVVYEYAHGDTRDLHDESREMAVVVGASIWF